MTTKLQNRYGEFAPVDMLAKSDMQWCEVTANTLDTMLIEMIEKKILERNGAYAKQLRSITSKVRNERAVIAEQLLDHLEGKEQVTVTLDPALPIESIPAVVDAIRQNQPNTAFVISQSQYDNMVASVKEEGYDTDCVINGTKKFNIVVG